MKDNERGQKIGEKRVNSWFSADDGLLNFTACRGSGRNKEEC